ncbi:MAG: hypothetical protein GOVbin2833_18 [Prokaryotic dsDNA virus sp.]|nr:MAG: hypothetical protein GOVbin2833_18 [Prokaryotic dsDNA virus sp.]|tara:strand:+ start:14920 stop:15645 length:726 start_codon:yes stop_codon:yes gene_type:complete
MTLTTTFNIPGSIGQGAGAEGGRYDIDHVMMAYDGERAVAIATDGVGLAICKATATGEPCTALVHPKSTPVGAAASKRDVIIDHDEHTARHGKWVTPCCVDGIFPEPKPAIPDSDEGVEWFPIDVSRLISFCMAVTSKQNRRVNIGIPTAPREPGSPHGNIGLRISGDSGQAIVLPAKWDNKTYTDWKQADLDCDIIIKTNELLKNRNSSSTVSDEAEMVEVSGAVDEANGYVTSDADTGL